MPNTKRQSAPPGTLELWQALRQPSCAQLLEEAAAIDATNPGAVQGLRVHWPADVVHVALELIAARRKAAAKFGVATAQKMMCDVTGVEQATSRLVAEHKAKRFDGAHLDRIVDLCCGIGGDALALSRVAPTVAVDRNDIRAWMAAHNASCESQCADVADVDVAGAFVHIDPDRRSGASGSRQRTWQYAAYEPGPDFLESLLGRSRGAAIKLGPGVGLEELPLTGDRELELISEHGNLVQAVLWSGALADNPGLRCATTLPAGSSFIGAFDQHVSMASISRFVYTIDPTVERAGLLGAFATDRSLPAVHPQVGLLTSDRALHDPFLTGFIVQDVLPWRLRKVQQWLGENDGGIVEIKTRGGVVNTDIVQRQLRGTGTTPFTVFVLRLDEKVLAIICSRAANSSDVAAGVID